MTDIENMAPGCCSAASPCNHQKLDPYTICDVCQKAAAHTGDAGLIERLREIEEDMRKPRSESRYWHDEQMRDEHLDLLDRLSSAALSSGTEEVEALRKERLVTDRHAGELCAYGVPSERKPVWIIKFEDADRGDAHFENEADAIAFYLRAADNWNCTLLTTVRVPAPEGHAQKEILRLQSELASAEAERDRMAECAKSTNADARDIVDILRDFPAVDVRTAILRLDPGAYCVIPDETREQTAKIIIALRAERDRMREALERMRSVLTEIRMRSNRFPNWLTDQIDAALTHGKDERASEEMQLL